MTRHSSSHTRHISGGAPGVGAGTDARSPATPGQTFLPRLWTTPEPTFDRRNRRSLNMQAGDRILTCAFRGKTAIGIQRGPL